MMKKGLDYYSVIYLLISWVAIRFLLFGMHGMKGRPDLLAFRGAVVIAAGFAMKMRLTTRFASLGYFVSFLAGYLLRKDDRSVSGIWLIWAIIYVLIVLMGVYLDLKMRKSTK